MKRLLVALCALIALSCAQDESARTSRGSGGVSANAQGQEREPAHEGHRMYRPEQVQWKDAPPSLPAGAKSALLEGDPAKPGFFAMRLRMPDGYRIPPHFHPGVERVTVLSGTFHLGTGERPDWDAMQELPAGSYTTMQSGMNHYARASGETVVQIATIGPWGITYVNPSDDPRQKKQP